MARAGAGCTPKDTAGGWRVKQKTRTPVFCPKSTRYARLNEGVPRHGLCPSADPISASTLTWRGRGSARTPRVPRRARCSPCPVARMRISHDPAQHRDEPEGRTCWQACCALPRFSGMKLRSTAPTPSFYPDVFAHLRPARPPARGQSGQAAPGAGSSRNLPTPPPRRSCGRKVRAPPAQIDTCRSTFRWSRRNRKHAADLFPQETGEGPVVLQLAARATR